MNKVLAKLAPMLVSPREFNEAYAEDSHTALGMLADGEITLDPKYVSKVRGCWRDGRWQTTQVQFSQDGVINTFGVA